MKGKLIVIDGTDASGKTVQTEKLLEALEQLGISTATFDFPRYDHMIGKLIKEEMLREKFGPIADLNPYFASSLYAGGRYLAIPQIDSALIHFDVVVSNRYTSANMEHQSGKIHNTQERSLFIDWLLDYEHEKLGIPRPDKVFFLHVPTEISMKLGKERGNLDSAESDKEHQLASEKAYVECAHRFSEWELISCTHDGNMRSIDEIHEEIFEKTMDILGFASSKTLK